MAVKELNEKLRRLGYFKGQVPSASLMTMIHKVSWVDGRKPLRKYRSHPDCTVLLVGDDWMVMELEDKKIQVCHVNWDKRTINFSYKLEDIA